MSKFVCNNPECGLYQKEIFFHKVSFIFSDGELKPNPPKICSCGVEMVQVQETKNGFPQFLKFNTLSNEDKRKSIVNRARSHDKKIKEETDFRNKCAFDNVKNSVK